MLCLVCDVRCAASSLAYLSYVKTAHGRTSYVWLCGSSSMCIARSLRQTHIFFLLLRGSFYLCMRTARRIVRWYKFRFNFAKPSEKCSRSRISTARLCFCFYISFTVFTKCNRLRVIFCLLSENILFHFYRRVW